jgi:hypothetical protein
MQPLRALRLPTGSSRATSLIKPNPSGPQLLLLPDGCNMNSALNSEGAVLLSKLWPDVRSTALDHTKLLAYFLEYPQSLIEIIHTV